MTIASAAAGLDQGHGGARWGRYVVYGEIASGGMATIDYGRLLGSRGFTRPVAIKRMHRHFANDPELVKMFVDEARMSSRLHHANVVATLDVIEGPGELALVMEYVHGETLSTLIELARASSEPVPVRIASSLLAGVLHGLHAAHEATNEEGVPLHIVHRDVSPQNVLVGQDGVARVLDFGVAKAIGRLRTTPSGEIKGKLAYIAPEQLCGAEVDRRADVYGASAMLWEVLTGGRLFDGPNESVVVHAVLNQVIEAPSRDNPDVPAALDRLVLRGLARSREERFASAREMALALEREVGTVTQSEVSDWLQRLAGERLAARARLLQQMEQAGERTAERAPASGARDVSATRKLELAGEGAPAAGREMRALGTPVVHAGTRARRARAYVTWTVLCATLIGAAIWSMASDNGDAAERETATVAAQPRAARSPEPAPEAAPVAAVHGAAAPAALEGSTTQAAEGERPAQPRPRTGAAKTAAKKSSAKPSPSARNAGPASGCIPPYVMDRQGVRHPKPECL